MTDKERVDAFIERLSADPDLVAIAVVLGPYRVMMGDASAIVAVIESVIAHWQATAPVELTT
jgi:polyphosphate kinase